MYSLNSNVILNIFFFILIDFRKIWQFKNQTNEEWPKKVVLNHVGKEVNRNIYLWFFK